MDNNMVELTYKHDHDCERKDVEFTVRPDCMYGVYMATTPTCIETGTALTLIKEEKS